MLFHETITSATGELLEKLINLPGFENLRLVGGTALALQYGHRKSIDIDLFGKLDLDEYALIAALEQIGKTIVLKKSANINIFSINGIKVDVVNYPYPWVDAPLNVDGFRMASPKDIGAMKLAAITGRGSKKDFVDIYFLLKKFSLSELMEFYTEKYADGSAFLVLKSLVYFSDAEEEKENPVMLKDIQWQEVKKTILKAHRDFVEE